MKKKLYGALLALAILTVFLLTFQSPEGTTNLSESVRLWLAQFGIVLTPHGIRSDVHLLMYFLLGIPLTLFGRECGWKWWQILLAGCAIGLLDESIKILLPTREFDLIDLLKDFLGIGAAIGLIELIHYRRADNG